MYSVKIRRARSRHCRDVRSHGHTTTAMHDNDCSPPPHPRAPNSLCGFCQHSPMIQLSYVNVKKSTSCPCFNAFSIFCRHLCENAESGDGTDIPPGFNNPPIKLKISGCGSVWVGMTNPLCEKSRSCLVQGYSDISMITDG